MVRFVRVVLGDGAVDVRREDNFFQPRAAAKIVSNRPRRAGLSLHEKILHNDNPRVAQDLFVEREFVSGSLRCLTIRIQFGLTIRILVSSFGIQMVKPSRGGLQLRPPYGYGRQTKQPDVAPR